MSLARLVMENVGVSTLKGLIAKNFKEERKLLPLKIEEDAYVRASGMADLCPREEVICSLLNTVRINKTTTDQNLVFAHGSALHWALQNKVLPYINVLIGQWICLSCGKIYGKWEGASSLSQGLVPRPVKCDTPNCISDEFYYKELHFKDSTYRIGGHPDGFLVIPGMQGIGLLEAKSASHFSAIKVQESPYLSHVVQCQVYMWLTRTHWAKILYWDKGDTGMSAFTEHTVFKDEEMISNIKEALKLIWDGIRDKKLPPRTICSEITCERAKKCNVSDYCFSKGNGIS